MKLSICVVCRLFSAAVLFASLQQAHSATYYVSSSGSNSNVGTAAAPFRTIQKAADILRAGDTVLIGPGNYAESVVTKAHGTSNAPIRFLANPPNDPANQVITTKFRVRHRFNIIEGLNFTGAQSLNMATIRVEFDPPTADGSHTIIRNNTIRDGVYLIADDLRFDSASNGITTGKGNWIARGFQPGGYVFLGSNSKEPYLNHDTAWRVKAVTPETIFLTNNAGSAFLEEPSSEVWGVIYAGNGNNGFPGIDIVPGSGEAATNCTIVGNTFSNLFGAPIKFRGENHLVESNFFTRLHGYYGIQPQGRNQVIRNNFWKDCTNFLFFTQYEIANIPHPMGADFFDYQVAFVSTFVDNSTDILFERNWIQNAHNQMGLISDAPGAYGFIMRSNVFVGVQTHLSGSRNGLVIENNTFYRCSFDEGRNIVLGLGGVRGQVQRDLIIRQNVFVDCGSRSSLDYEGFYAVLDAEKPLTNFNFVCGPEIMNYAGKRYFLEANGINGGDPVLMDTLNPLGSDGLPFTDDDGLRPLPNSPFAELGWGALRPAAITQGIPFAHFRVTSPAGWFDPVGTNYNPGWVALKPHERGDVMRPYYTPDALGAAPVTATFSSANSIGGTTGDATGIVSYKWDFGDGSSSTTTGPVVSHRYLSPGNYLVTLTVTNSTGGTATHQRRYRVLSSADPNRPLAPRNLRISGDD